MRIYCTFGKFQEIVMRQTLQSLKVLKLLKHLRRSVFVANILNQNNTHIENCEIGQNMYGGYVVMQQVLNRPIQNRECLKKDRKINHAKSIPHGDMAVSIFDGQKKFMQIDRVDDIVMQI